MKKSAAINNTARSRRTLAENNKNTASKKVSKKQPTVKEKHAPVSDTVTLTQSEFDAIVGAIGKLSMEKGKYRFGVL